MAKRQNANRFQKGPFICERIVFESYDLSVFFFYVWKRVTNYNVFSRVLSNTRHKVWFDKTLTVTQISLALCKFESVFLQFYCYANTIVLRLLLFVYI